MTHDPLCPEYGCDYGDCFSQSFSDAFCQCALIAKVRGDEMNKVAGVLASAAQACVYGAWSSHQTQSSHPRACPSSVHP